VALLCCSLEQSRSRFEIDLCSSSSYSCSSAVSVAVPIAQGEFILCCCIALSCGLGEVGCCMCCCCRCCSSRRICVLGLESCSCTYPFFCYTASSFPCVLARALRGRSGDTWQVPPRTEDSLASGERGNSAFASTAPRRSVVAHPWPEVWADSWRSSLGLPSGL